jgi:uncharacterized protein YjbI with pentapeptide repeats
MPSSTLGLFVVAGLAIVSSAGMAQERPAGAEERPYRYTIWDLKLGSHARELSHTAYVDLACGTNGGPPSVPLESWLDYGKCKPEAGSGLHEVYFRYDDELEYRTLARDPDRVGMYRSEGTSEFQIPVIVSALFDDNGFLIGTRLISDPRTDVLTRERGTNLAGVFTARFGETGFDCVDLPPREGEEPYRGDFIKERCETVDMQAGIRRVMEKHYYRKPGQKLLDPVTGQRTVGYFVSETRLESFLLEPIADPEARMAALHEPEPTEVEKLAVRARNCPGCDLHGANLKRADLRNANLAGANLTGANLHGAKLGGANLHAAQLPKANLNRADLSRANLAEANLIETQLYQAKLDGADLSRADMSGAAAARLQMIRGKAHGLYGMEADLRYARLSESDLSGADLSLSRLQRAQLSRVSLKGATLQDTILWEANLSDADLSGVRAALADFTGAKLRGADVTGADFRASVFTLTALTAAQFASADFAGAKLPAGHR